MQNRKAFSAVGKGHLTNAAEPINGLKLHSFPKYYRSVNLTLVLGKVMEKISLSAMHVRYTTTVQSGSVSMGL